MIRTPEVISANLAVLDLNTENLKQRIRETTDIYAVNKINLMLIEDEIEQHFKLENQMMSEMGEPLTPIHLEEHRKILDSIALLKLSWKRKQISDNIYSRAICYKLEFHYHYFDRPQLLNLAEEIATTMIKS